MDHVPVAQLSHSLFGLWAFSHSRRSMLRCWEVEQVSTFTIPATDAESHIATILVSENQTSVWSEISSCAGETAPKKHVPGSPLFGSFRNLLTYPKNNGLGGREF